ncbi:MAG TPA: hypothetical protein VM012_12135 [Flavitalea sp.]|nr:hypothetical protein [Flavitalea sp.]
MKKFYVSVVCLLFAALSYSQNIYWRLAPGVQGDYDDPTNWSFTPGGGSAGVYPNGTTYNVIFDRNALVRIDIANILVNSVTVLSGNTATLFTDNVPGGTNTFAVDDPTNALNIQANATLIDSANTGSFKFNLDPNAVGVVNGTWYFSGSNLVPAGEGSTFSVNNIPSTLNVNGRIILRPGSTPVLAQGSTLFFNANSLYWLDADGGSVPKATWNATSTINLTGVVNTLPVVNVPSNPHPVGNVIFNSPNMATDLGWSLTRSLIIQGNFEFINTNNNVLTIASNQGASGSTVSYTVNGDFIVRPNANLAFANPDENHEYVLNILGDYIQTGGIFSIRNDNTLPTLPATVKLQGDFQQTAGTFTTNSTATSTSIDLFVLELNGTSPQTISASSGTIDNATHQVTLRMNNASGATLNTPLETGRISFNSANKGRLTTTSTNVLTIGNPSSTDALVVNSPSNSGYVNGPVRRRTNEMLVAYLLPTGKGGVYHGVQVIPSTTAPSIYRGEYFNFGYSDLSVASPLLGVSNQEYWDMNIDGGTSASVQLTLNGTAVPGAGFTDKIAVATYNPPPTAPDWIASKGTFGTTLTPGTSTTGSVRSDMLNFSQDLFTFGYAPANSLAVDLITFNAKKGNGNSALLNWEITFNSTPEHFEVLRSADGRTFTGVGNVRGIDQKGKYDFTDLSLPQGTSYYKLKIFDQDGAVSYSRILAVINGGKGFLITSMMPTIVKSRARLNVSSTEKGSMQVVVSDSYGRIIRTQMAGIVSGNQEVWLDLSSLAVGAYQVTGYMNGQRTETIRFVKQ